MDYLVYSILAVVFSIVLSISGDLETLVGGSLPHLSILLVIFVALQKGPLLGMLTGFIAGIVFDVSSVLPLGFHVLTFTTVGFLLGRFRGAFLLDKVIGPILISAGSLLFVNVIGLAISGIFSLHVAILTWSTALELIYTAIFAPLMSLLVGLLESLLRRRPGGRFK